jgi:hypothetical protein
VVLLYRQTTLDNSIRYVWYERQGITSTSSPTPHPLYLCSLLHAVAHRHRTPRAILYCKMNECHAMPPLKRYKGNQAKTSRALALALGQAKPGLTTHCRQSSASFRSSRARCWPVDGWSRGNACEEAASWGMPVRWRRSRGSRTRNPGTEYSRVKGNPSRDWSCAGCR